MIPGITVTVRQDSMYIDIQKTVVDPVHLEDFLPKMSSWPSLHLILRVHPHVLVTLYDNTVPVTYPVTITVDIARGAKLVVMSRQLYTESMYGVRRWEVCLAQHGQLEATLVQGVFGHLRTEIAVRMQGGGAQAHWRIVSVCADHAKLDIVSTQDHQVADTVSALTMRALVNDAARCGYRGLVHIAPHADGVAADQDHKALLMSNQAHASADPVLEVLTNRVRCSHASAVGHLDKEQLWYMQTRGMSYERAQRLLVTSFLVEGVADGTALQVKSMVQDMAEHAQVL